jgi:Mu transposase, C-terminal domain
MKLMREINKGNSIEISSLKSGMHPKTGRKYIKLGKLPSDFKKPHDWRTRKDPFEKDWDYIKGLIENAPELQAKTIMFSLIREHPERYHDGQVRTLQRRIRDWKAISGPDREVFFTQEHIPGEAMQLDFTDCNKLGVTIQRKPFKFKLNHIVLPYSNWEWATICFSESFEALKKGLKAALIRLGYTTKWLQTDNSTSATHKIAKGGNKSKDNIDEFVRIPPGREFNDAYRSLVKSLGMVPRTISIGKKQQNGDVESLHNSIKNRIKQYLLLRGHSDFESIDELQEYINEICFRGNKNRSERFAIESSYLSKLHIINIQEYTVIETRVRNNSTIIVKHHVYSVPSRLVGEKVNIHIYENKILIFYKNKLQREATRIHKENVHNINYRDLVKPMMKKPGALARYKYQSYMFPSLIFRKAYDILLEHHTERKAGLEYLRILNLCMEFMEVEVEEALKLMLEEDMLPYFTDIQSLLGTYEPVYPQMEGFTPDLDIYDSLLSGSQMMMEGGN